MRDNLLTTIQGNKVLLVPYKRKFVKKYHQWMEDPFLQEMTASEPLSLEGEYEMQESWREDSKKCTFIILAVPAVTTSSSDDGTEPDKEIASMIGDVNMFLNDRDDPTIAELEIMIAEANYRGKGCGREALALMMHYGATVLGLSKFYVKINQANVSSLGLFKR